MAARSYRDLKVWRKAMDLVADCYGLAARLPDYERYGLASQLQRAAVSIPANIAEGNGREHVGEYQHHVSIAHGSLMELETHILLIQRLHRFDATEIDAFLLKTSEVGRMLGGLRKSLKARARS